VGFEDGNTPAEGFGLMNIIAKPVNFLKEVRTELSKVSWSTRKELMASTVLVITVTGLMTIFIGIVDLGLSRFLSVVFK
jgi:preprotein translocase subunit SecE